MFHCAELWGWYNYSGDHPRLLDQYHQPLIGDQAVAVLQGLSAFQEDPSLAAVVEQDAQAALDPLVEGQGHRSFGPHRFPRLRGETNHRRKHLAQARVNVERTAET